MLKSRITLIITIMILPVFLWSQNSQRQIIDSGHSSPVESMNHSSNANTLISVDSSGLVKVWDLESDSLIHQIDTGLEGSIQMKSHPEKKQIALLASRPGFTRLAVWDWEKSRELFSRDLSDRPIQFDYSGKGNFLFTTRINTPSIVLMDSQTGRSYSYLKRVYDLFSYGYIGSSERIIMTYSNSGTIKYLDMRTGAIKGTAVSTTSGLSRLTVLQTESKRNFIALKGETLYLIDRSNGSVQNSMTIEDMLDFSADPESGIVSVIQESSTGRLKVMFLDTKGSRFTPLDINNFMGEQSYAGFEEFTGSTDFFTITGSLTASLVKDNRIFFSDSNGIIWQINPDTRRPEVFKKNLISQIRDINFIDDSLYILSDKNLLRLQSGGFDKKTRTLSLKNFSDLSILPLPSPLPGNSEIEAVDSDRMVIWTRDSVEKGYVLYNPQKQSILNSNFNFESPLNQVHIRNDQVLVLENSGEASLNNIHTGFRDFNFSALGMVSLNFLNDSTLLGGKSLMKSGKDPMFTVQTDTGEKIPLQDNRFLVYDILSPADSNKTFTIGLSQKSSDAVETVIRSHSNSNPGSVSTVYTRSGEWIHSQFTADTSSYTAILYGTVTGRDIIRIAGSRKKIWTYDNNIEKIFFHNSLLYILNTDGSLSLFNPLSGRKVLDYYLMEDGNWIVLPDSRLSPKPYISSRRAADYLNTYSTSGSRSIRNSYYIYKPLNKDTDTL